MPERTAMGRLGIALGACALALLCVSSANGQNYSVVWGRMTGGGGTSTGGAYSLSGAIALPEAGTPLTGGGYSLTGGFPEFWAPPSGGTPTLHILMTSTNTAILWWPSASVGWNLQETSDLGAGNWATPAETIHDDGTTRSITLTPPIGTRFYRLSRP